MVKRRRKGGIALLDRGLYNPEYVPVKEEKMLHFLLLLLLFCVISFRNFEFPLGDD